MLCWRCSEKAKMFTDASLFQRPFLENFTLLVTWNVWINFFQMKSWSTVVRSEFKLIKPFKVLKYNSLKTSNQKLNSRCFTLFTSNLRLVHLREDFCYSRLTSTSATDAKAISRKLFNVDFYIAWKHETTLRTFSDEACSKQKSEVNSWSEAHAIDFEMPSNVMKLVV